MKRAPKLKIEGGICGEDLLIGIKTSLCPFLRASNNIGSSVHSPHHSFEILDATQLSSKISLNNNRLIGVSIRNKVGGVTLKNR